MPELAMKHPEIPGEIAFTTQEAFDLVWKIRGWEITDVPQDEVSAEYNVDDVKAAKGDPENVIADPGSDAAKAAKKETSATASSHKTPQGEVGIDG